MAGIKTLLDEFGIIFEANKILPSTDLKIKFIEALAELEDNYAHKTRQFPKTRLHKVVGVKPDKGDPVKEEQVYLRALSS
jgi:hypothetical protein